MINAMSRKKVMLLMMVVFLTLAFTACGNNREKKECAKIRDVAQKYFDALKINDQEGIYDCYLPTERQNRDAELGILGFMSKAILKVDLAEIFSDLDTLFGGENTFAQYKYKAMDVDLSEDGTEAIAYVSVYEETEWVGSVQVNMTKYDGSWYVVRGTIADDERNPDGEADEESENSIMAGLSKQIWIPILFAVVFIVIAIFFIRLLYSRSRKKRASIEIPPTAPGTGGGIEQGDILCSCGTVNPAGIRTCIGCGRKLKKRR